MDRETVKGRTFSDIAISLLLIQLSNLNKNCVI